MPDRQKPCLEDDLKQRAYAVGFDIVRITKAELSSEIADRLDGYLNLGHHGDMEWMQQTRDRRIHPQSLWADSKGSIILGMNYGPESNPLERLKSATLANVSVYAQNRDYHDIIKGRLKTLGQWLVGKTNGQIKVFTDTAPLMEKPLAAKAGLGWQGKHTNLVSRQFGSWLFLGVILTDFELRPDEPENDHCGGCRACLDICPTNAFPAPYQLDARRCISYLTIEHKGHIAREFRRPMANRIYGCDDCLAVCPWNKFAKKCQEAKLRARPDIASLGLSELLGFDDVKFRKVFSGSPVKRSGRDRILRNALIAAGNSHDTSLKPFAIALLKDPCELVRAMAVWALEQLAAPAEFQHHRRRHDDTEPSAAVRREWSGSKPLK